MWDERLIIEISMYIYDDSVITTMVVWWVLEIIRVMRCVHAQDL